MKKLFTLLLSLLCLGTVYAADETNDAIYVWIEGDYTCYQLESMPKITYDNGSVVLRLSDKTEPELTLALNDENKLRVTYGIYKDPVTTTIDETPVTRVSKVGKYIYGGRLIIVKDGKQYDANGTEIK